MASASRLFCVRLTGVVVLGVIAIIIATVYVRTRPPVARRNTGLSKIKQLATATMIYVSDAEKAGKAHRAKLEQQAKSPKGAK